MGLAAGQARLLSITARKSDCEFQSMTLSHQKIAMSRQLADLSNEYQNSLDQTKLVYDYYGTGDESTPLSYGILMNPSTLNDYKPTFITTAENRIVLNSKYAQAAKAAGIPQEGLGCLPSEGMRNQFISSLSKAGLISNQMATTILGYTDPNTGLPVHGIPYNQGAGLGSTDDVIVQTTTKLTYDEFLKYINTKCTQTFSNLPSGVVFQNTTGIHTGWDSGSSCATYAPATGQTTLAQLLALDSDTTLLAYSNRGDKSAGVGTAKIQAYIDPNTGQFMKDLKAALQQVFGSNDAIEFAFEYADTKFKELNIGNTVNRVANCKGTAWRTHDFVRKANSAAPSYLGITTCEQHGAKVAVKHRCPASSVSITNIAKAYLTLFMKKYEGTENVNENYQDRYWVQAGDMSANRFYDGDTVFTVVTGTDISDDQIQSAKYYDTLFNQLCINGWTENNNIDDNEYLQQMLQSGMMYISKQKDDNYYYQGNYASDPYIKEVADDTLIAQAEAKYNTEKTKLNAKEETLDLKMKNLDTEISSLTTEYDTIKNTISKNIEKSFKRYSA